MAGDRLDAVIDCRKCSYFKITWEPAFPHACLVFDIKSRNFPSLEVFQATGRQCPSFQEKERKDRDE
ncbi:MAG: hypothetical protein LBD58_11840 [Treponema sp.]|nr:hypothetical protein [Treponema sp.]